ncbi:hypothetical protein [Paraburkholderia silvatlantica]|uniref:hypothetical protein n=1 Tax=Paraburkholderia silvatlantica TaxID=321895 RepID=UPI0037529DD8
MLSLQFQIQPHRPRVAAVVRDMDSTTGRISPLKLAGTKRPPESTFRDHSQQHHDNQSDAPRTSLPRPLRRTVGKQARHFGDPEAGDHRDAGRDRKKHNVRAEGNQGTGIHFSSLRKKAARNGNANASPPIREADVEEKE